MMMELEISFLSNELQMSPDKCKLPTILQQILSDLNSKKMCTITGTVLWWWNLKF